MPLIVTPCNEVIVVALTSSAKPSTPNRTLPASGNKKRIENLSGTCDSRFTTQSSHSNDGCLRCKKCIRQNAPRDHTEEHERYRPSSTSTRSGTLITLRVYLHHPGERRTGKRIRVHQRCAPRMCTGPYIYQYRFHPLGLEIFD